MDKQTKIFRGKIKSIDEEKFIVSAIVSDETIDRHNEIVLADSYKKRLKRYKEHSVLLSSHNYHGLTNIIGKAEKVYVEGNSLHADFRYFVGEGNLEADWAFKLAKNGIAAYSVGFIPHEYKETPYEEWKESKGKKPRVTYTDVELLEISHVTVPANPTALQKGFDGEDADPIVKGVWDEVIKLLEKDETDKGEGTVISKEEIEEETVDINEVEKSIEEKVEEVEKEITKEKDVEIKAEEMAADMAEMKKMMASMNKSMEEMYKMCADTCAMCEAMMEMMSGEEDMNMEEESLSAESSYVKDVLQGLGDIKSSLSAKSK